MNIILNKLPNPLPDNTFVGLDSEWWGLNSKQLHRPTSGRFAALTICPNDEDVYVITDDDLVEIALGRVDNCIQVYQNSKFDLRHLRRHSRIPQRAKMWDTMLIERIMWNGHYPKRGFGLEDLSRRHLDIYVDKSLQKSFEVDLGEMTPEQLEYSAKDALYTRQIAIKQSEQISKMDFKIWREIENPVLWAMLDFQGFPIDVDGWKEHAKDNIRRKEESDATFAFNPRSPGKNGAVAKYMKSEFDIDIPGNTIDVFEQLLTSHKGTKVEEFARSILENKQYSNWVSDWGENFVDFAEWDDRYGWCIFSDFWTIGADTGRMAASDPPIHGVPFRYTPLGVRPQFRFYFKAPEGHDFIRSDYPSQEPRMIAYKSGDKELIALFNSGGCPYSSLGKMYYKEEITKTDPRRDRMKALFLGAGYGLTPHGMNTKYGIPKKEGKAMQNFMFSSFPKLGRYVREQKEKKSKVHTAIGRTFHLDPYGGWHTQNNALNSPIQGSGADMIKIAIVKLHKMGFDPFPIIMPHHDELIAIAPKDISRDVAKVIGKAMQEAGEEMTQGRLPFPVTPTICSSWGDDK